jgi:hypothetical protein
MRMALAMALLFLASCHGGDVPPSGLLERDRFKEVLLQAQLIEARVNHELIVEHISQVPTDRYYAEMFKEQGVTEEEFTKTFRYYAATPKEMKAIYEEIITELTFRKDQPVD